MIPRLRFRWFGLAALAAAVVIGCSPVHQSSSSSPSTTADQSVTVAVTQIVEHPALDAVRDGIKAELIAAGYEEGKNLTWEWESAQGNPATAAQIASKFVGESPDVIVAIATPSAQAVVAATDSIPVIFSAVTDPVAAKLVDNLETPGGMVSGVSDLSPIGQHLDLILEITPEVKSLGVLYNSGEANSVSLIKLLQAEAQPRNLSLQEATVSSSSDVATAARSLVGQVDAIYVPTDNTVVSALEAVIQVGIDNQLPIYAGDTDSVARGAIAGLSFNYSDVGTQTGKMVVRVLKGEKPGDIAVEQVEKLELHVNLGSATKMGITIPETVVAKANRVID